MPHETADPFVELARAAVEKWVRDGVKLDAPTPLPPAMQAPSGAFVCLKMEGELRGCIGTIEPNEDNLAAEVINNAISSASRDPRFMPVSGYELAELEYTVDVLGEPESISGLDELDPRRYGVIVESGGRRGVLLPDLEGVDTAEAQVQIASQKAGIFKGEPMRLYRFEVIRHGR